MSAISLGGKQGSSSSAKGENENFSSSSSEIEGKQKLMGDTKEKQEEENSIRRGKEEMS